MKQEIFNDLELLAVHKEIKSIRDQHIAHLVSDHELCVVLAAVPDLSRNELVGLGVKYWFFALDMAEKLSAYRKPLKFALSYDNAEVEKIGNRLSKDLLGEGQTWILHRKLFGRYCLQKTFSDHGLTTP